MNKKLHFIYLFLGGVMLAGVTACSGSDDDEPTKTDDGVKVRRLTITETDGSTRALIVEGDGILNASWTKGDRVTYCNLMRTKSGGYDPIYGNLTAASSAATSQFTGNVTCSVSDYLAVVYPATTFETNDSYTISLTGQDGTLSKLATKYHYVFGKATVTEATETTADATMPKMKSLLTVCKFSFIDKATNLPIPIQTLTISYGGTGEDAGTYPQTATVKIIDGKILDQANVHAIGVASNSSLLVDCSGDSSTPLELGRLTSPCCPPPPSVPTTSPSPTAAAPTPAPPRPRSLRVSTSQLRG